MDFFQQQPTQYPMPTAVNLNPYGGASGFQTAMPLPKPTQQRFKIVNRLEDITINDIPMDGTPGIFPISDGSAIYVKSWKSDGTINTIEYLPKNIEPEIKPKSEIDELKEWLDFKFEALAKPTSRTKKEVQADG